MIKKIKNDQLDHLLIAELEISNNYNNPKISYASIEFWKNGNFEFEPSNEWI